eukprot:595074-Rhodomonas_salina.1
MQSGHHIPSQDTYPSVTLGSVRLNGCGLRSSTRTSGWSRSAVPSALEYPATMTTAAITLSTPDTQFRPL